MRTVGITLDLTEYDQFQAVRAPAPGDLVASLLRDGTYGATYQIIQAREVRRHNRHAPPRFSLRCLRVTLPGLQDRWLIDWRFQWYPRRSSHGRPVRPY